VLGRDKADAITQFINKNPCQGTRSFEFDSKRIERTMEGVICFFLQEENDMETIKGTIDNDILNGTTSSYAIGGALGKDTINLGDGDDILVFSKDALPGYESYQYDSYTPTLYDWESTFQYYYPTIVLKPSATPAELLDYTTATLDLSNSSYANFDIPNFEVH
jgi:hypothetical protein